MTETTTPKPTDSDNEDDWPRPTPEAERAMREFLATLPPPPSAEELARRQGKPWPLPTYDELVALTETIDWGDAWDGFDEFLDDLRHDRDLSRWLVPEPQDEE